MRTKLTKITQNPILKNPSSGLSEFRQTAAMLGIAIMLFFAQAANAQFASGSGTDDDPYIIATAEQLAQLATEDNNGKHYKLGGNIDLSDYQAGDGWMPIYFYNGVFDGDGNKITGLTINSICQMERLTRHTVKRCPQ